MAAPEKLPPRLAAQVGPEAKRASVRSDLFALADALCEEPLDAATVRQLAASVREGFSRTGADSSLLDRHLWNMLHDLGNPARPFDALHYANQFTLMADRL
jgi:hypothetical protein